MKLQLFILSALLICALAHPVPDEEVSPVKAALAVDAKPELTQAPAEKPLEDAKTEIRAPEETKLEKKLPEKLALPEIAPDAEIAQTIPDKKEEKLAIEKQTRSENKVGADVKTLPVVQTPVAGIEAEKQMVDEVKPAVKEVQLIGKNPDIAAETPAAPEALISEQKKDELSAVESAPAVKSEIPIVAETTAAIAEEKKEELPARQERGTEEQIKLAASEEAVKPAIDAPVGPASPEVQQEIKNLKPTEGQLEAAKTEEIAPLTPVVPALLNKPAEPAPAAGDIPTQPQIALESNIKALPIAAEKPEAAPALATAQAAKNIEEPIVAKPLEVLPETPIVAAPVAAPVSTEPLKKLEEKPAAAIEDKKSEESKESKESKESDSDSKESGESKENKSN